MPTTYAEWCEPPEDEDDYDSQFDDLSDGDEPDAWACEVAASQAEDRYIAMLDARASQ
jgi:hypothetical protein